MSEDKKEEGKAVLKDVPVGEAVSTPVIAEVEKSISATNDRDIKDEGEVSDAGKEEKKVGDDKTNAAAVEEDEVDGRDSKGGIGEGEKVAEEEVEEKDEGKEGKEKGKESEEKGKDKEKGEGEEGPAEEKGKKDHKQDAAEDKRLARKKLMFDINAKVLKAGWLVKKGNSLNSFLIYFTYFKGLV